MKVGSLFSGIGGLDLGLEQAGMKTVWQVEFDDWTRERLTENFPHTEKYKDVKTVGKNSGAYSPIRFPCRDYCDSLKPIDVLCGGFPCQDISAAKMGGKGLDGERSGLWFEMFRILCELRPKYALIENVSNLINLGLDRVLSDLASVGYDAEWQTIRASSFGLPHRRKRLFIIAYPNRFGLEKILLKGRIHPSYEQQFNARNAVFVGDIGRSFIEIPEHLRMDNGLSARVSALKPIVKGYGNAVAPPVAKWLGERILDFDNSLA